ncbi:MAG: TPM domain-containing protein, partial [Brachymonas sp.]|nr:TPM domain-containing protein [Brachymonas sp.]
RALFRCMEQSAWSAITTQLAAALRAQQYESGLQTALAQISDVLIAHFPANAQTPRDNTVADAPVLLR